MKRLFGITTVLTTLICLACAPKHSPTVAEGKIYSNGTQLYYKTIGAGQPVVIVHGGPLLDHSYFLPSFEQLAQDFQLIFYDQRLSGRSDPNADTSTIRMRVFVEDIEKLRDSLKLGRVHLLGHSWGGLIAMHYAIKHGTNLRSLTLSNSMSASSAIWQEEGGCSCRENGSDRQSGTRCHTCLRIVSQLCSNGYREVTSNFIPQAIPRSGKTCADADLRSERLPRKECEVWSYDGRSDEL